MMPRLSKKRINTEALLAEKTELVLKYLCTQQEVKPADKAKALERVKEIRDMLKPSIIVKDEAEIEDKPKRKTKIKRKKL
jgi:hypothetical protein